MSKASVRSINQALSSGLAELTSGLLEGQASVQDGQYAIAAAELIQRIQVPVTGVASRSMIYTEIDVGWAYPIINLLAGSQHESNQETPHFNSGVELLTDEHVIFDAQVRSWMQDDSDFYTGARVRLCAWAPDTLKTTKYSAVLHLTFFGYAAAAEDDDDTQNSSEAP